MLMFMKLTSALHRQIMKPSTSKYIAATIVAPTKQLEDEVVDIIALCAMYPGYGIIDLVEAQETEFPIGTVIVWRPNNTNYAMVLEPGRNR